MTSRLSFPSTYYRNIRALEPGCIHTIDLKDGRAAYGSKTRYFQFDFKVDPQATERDLAEELATAFKQAVRRRTLPLFGRTGIGLSGGLDSRTILSAADVRNELRGFCLYDQENVEFRTARAIAGTAGVGFVPLKRDFEYYGNSAEQGVRISGGTGCVTCNHFLGIRDRLNELGITNILTGCYCDYLFKGLAINRAERPVSRSYELGRFQFEFYDSYHWLDTPYRQEVVARLEGLFPESSKAAMSDEDWLSVERKRSFPLAYEQDLAQRVIPQRVMPWYVPIADNEIINTYLKIPSRFKLNASIFKKMLPFVCRDGLCEIPDSNTGARINAAWPEYAWAKYSSSLRNRMVEKIFPQLATRGSWPNWQHYFKHSGVIKSLWTRPNRTARDVFTGILGWDPFGKQIGEYTGPDVLLFQRLLTQKLWFDQRA